ncbi:unnamed protein product, partial [Ranitomeya imitator]
IAQLNALINMLLGELTPGVRQKIMTICTIDVHARDVVAKLIAQKIGYISVIKMHFGTNLPASRFGGGTAHAPAILQDGGAQGEDGRTDTGRPDFPHLIQVYEKNGEKMQRTLLERRYEWQLQHQMQGQRLLVELSPARSVWYPVGTRAAHGCRTCATLMFTRLQLFPVPLRFCTAILRLTRRNGHNLLVRPLCLRNLDICMSPTVSEKCLDRDYCYERQFRITMDMEVSNGQAFTWLSQLRHRWDEEKKECYVNICDAQFHYSYEFLGNTPRLVITPLTDRCYITLTQSLHLAMSGALSGPAGTGKTETTKDLGRALGIMVYVFNCSEQMDYKSLGNIYKGLCQTGVWGCFDEFNRISVEVLSVIAVQVKAIQDAIRHNKKRFHFLGETIELKSTVGIFITLNPGYAGRAELPENVKALFRPCAMVIPDFELICEIMLVAEGFVDARMLSRKFISLYTLCRQLLSKQLAILIVVLLAGSSGTQRERLRTEEDIVYVSPPHQHMSEVVGHIDEVFLQDTHDQDHYDWGLRAIKSVLVVAGSLKREDRSRPEDQR